MCARVKNEREGACRLPPLGAEEGWGGGSIRCSLSLAFQTVGIRLVVLRSRRATMWRATRVVSVPPAFDGFRLTGPALWLGQPSSIVCCRPWMRDYRTIPTPA